MPQTSLANDPAQGYFLYHSIGQYPEKQADLTAAMAEFAQVWAAPNGAQWGYVLEKRAAFVDCWRQILNCPEGTATTCESVTDGMHMLIRSLPETMLKGKRVLVTADCFPSLHFLLAGLAPKMGFTLETVPMSEGKSWVETEDMIARWGRDVALGLVTWVTSTASARCDVGALAAKDLKERLPGMLVRQTLRATAKYNLQKEANDNYGALGAFATQIYNLVSEQADRRSWLTLPAYAQATRVSLPQGEHTLLLSTPQGDATLTVPVVNRGLTVIHVVAVPGRLITRVLPVQEGPL